MLREIDNFYLGKEEMTRNCLLALRKFILASDKEMTEAWRYGMPFFYYKKKMFCYLWVNKKTAEPYLGMVEGRKLNHPKLISEKRSRMKIMTIDPSKDLPVRTIGTILKEARNLYPKKN